MDQSSTAEFNSYTSIKLDTMEKFDSTTHLKAMIRLKEAEQAAEGKLLLIEFRRASENLKPANIIRNTLKDMVATPEMKTTLINAAIGWATGFLAKKLMVGNSHNPLTKIGGALVETAVGNAAMNNAETIKNVGGMLFNKIFSKRSA